MGTHERCWVVEFEAEAKAAQHNAKSLILVGRAASEIVESGRREMSSDLTEKLV